MKTVNLKNYTLFHTSEDDWEFERTECKNKCVYQKVGEDPDFKFCFKTGSHDSQCIGDDIAYFHLDSKSFSFSFLNEAMEQCRMTSIKILNNISSIHKILEKSVYTPGINTFFSIKQTHLSFLGFFKTEH